MRIIVFLFFILVPVFSLTQSIPVLFMFIFYIALNYTFLAILFRFLGNFKTGCIIKARRKQYKTIKPSYHNHETESVEANRWDIVSHTWKGAWILVIRSGGSNPFPSSLLWKPPRSVSCLIYVIITLPGIEAAGLRISDLHIWIEFPFLLPSIQTLQKHK